MIDYDNSATTEDILLAESIARQFLGEVDAQPVQIPIGSVNKVFRVEVGGKSYIIRLTQDIYRMAQDTHRMNEYQKESWCAQRARTAGVPTPEIIKVGTIDNAAFMIQEFVEGTLGTDDTLDELQLWESLGQNVAKIHSIPTSGRGPDLLDPDANQFSESWDRYVEYNINAINPDDILLFLDYVNGAEHARLRECFVAIGQKKWRFGLSHCDLSLRNTIFNSEGQLVIIDWGCATSDPVPHHDFALILKSVQPSREQFETFFQAYGLQLSEFAQVKATIAQILLLSATDTLRWAIDKKVVARKRYVASLRWALDVYLERIDWFDEPYHETYGLDKLVF